MHRIRESAQTKLVLAAAVACIAFTVAHAFAASLGAGSGGFAATSRMAASCGTGMRFAYTTAFSTASGDAVTGINLSSIPTGCLSKSLSVTFYNGSDDVTGSAISATLPATGTTRSISVNPGSNAIDVSQISGVSVVVS